MEGEELNGEDITILQVTGTEDSFGGRKNESEGHIQKTMKGTGMAGRKEKGASINEDTSMFNS